MKQLTALILLLTMPLPSLAAVYYVDADAADGGNGTTTATSGANCAWNATTDITGLAAGDTVLFHRGDIFPGLLTASTDGTAVARITYGAYGTGDKPIFDRSVTLASGSSWTLADSVYSIAVAGLNAATGCWVDGTTPLIKGASASLTAGQFYPDAANDILYVRMADNSDPGLVDIVVGGYIESVYCTADYITLQDLHFRHCDYDGTRRGVFFSSPIAPIVQRCEFSRCVVRPLRIYRPVGAVLIDGCEWHDNWNGLAYGSGGQPGPMTIDEGGTPTSYTISHCYLHDNYLGLIVYEWDDAPMYVYGNIIANNYVNGCELDGSLTNPVYFYNNTIYHKPVPAVIAGNGHGLIVRTGTTDHAVIIKNNIFYFDENGVSGAEVIQIDEADFDQIDIDYNVYYAIPTPTQTFTYPGGPSNDLADWQAWLDTTSYSGKDAHSVNADPLFTNAAGADFTLLAGSPCIDAGTDLGDDYDTDYVGNDMDPFGWEIGAYAFIQSFGQQGIKANLNGVLNGVLQ